MSQPPLRPYVLTWLALLVLLALSAGSSLLPLGVFNLVGNFGIAVAKAGLVLLVFMRFGRGAPMIGIIAAAAVLLLAVMVGLGVADFVARAG